MWEKVWDGNTALPAGKEECPVKKNIGRLAVVMLPLLLLTGCGPIGEKQTSMAVIYGVLAALSLLLLLCYCLVIKKKETFFLLLFSAIAVSFSRRSSRPSD